jgi:F0F1-type ATP synthase epsilon subunit
MSKKDIDVVVPLHVQIISPRTTYFDGKAASVSAINETGVFDILPYHHNFISLLNACAITIATTAGSQKSVDILRGIMHVKDNEVVIFVDV